MLVMPDRRGRLWLVFSEDPAVRGILRSHGQRLEDIPLAQNWEARREINNGVSVLPNQPAWVIPHTHDEIHHAIRQLGLFPQNVPLRISTWGQNVTPGDTMIFLSRETQIKCRILKIAASATATPLRAPTLTVISSHREPSIPVIRTNTADTSGIRLAFPSPISGNKRGTLLPQRPLKYVLGK